MTQRLTGIILQAKNFRENDKVISFYSRQSGKIEILVRGARKITSKLAPIISEPFALLILTVAPGKNFYHLIGGEIEKYFKNILNDYIKITRTARILARIDGLIKPRKIDIKIFNLIIKFLERINQVPGAKIPIVNYAFLIKFLAFSGYRPEIKHCLICRKPLLSEELYFDFQKGGIICPNCRQASQGQMKITFKVLRILQNLLYKDFNFLEKQVFVQKDFVLAQKVIKRFFQWQFD